MYFLFFLLQNYVLDVTISLHISYTTNEGSIIAVGLYDGPFFYPRRCGTPLETRHATSLRVSQFSILHFQFKKFSMNKKSLPSEIERQGFHTFKIPRSPFARLRAEHKLYITLLLILTPRFRLRRVLAYSFHSSP